MLLRKAPKGRLAALCAMRCLLFHRSCRRSRVLTSGCGLLTLCYFVNQERGIRCGMSPSLLGAKSTCGSNDAREACSSDCRKGLARRGMSGEIPSTSPYPEMIRMGVLGQMIAHVLRKLRSSHSRHDMVSDEKIKMLPTLYRLERVLGGARLDNFEIEVGEHIGRGQANYFFVINEKDHARDRPLARALDGWLDLAGRVVADWKP